MYSGQGQIRKAQECNAQRQRWAETSALQDAACLLRRNKLCVLYQDALEFNAGSTARLLSYPSFRVSQGNVEDMLTLTDSLQKIDTIRFVWGHWFRFPIDWSGPPRFVPTHPHVGAAWVSINKQQKQRNDINIYNLNHHLVL